METQTDPVDAGQDIQNFLNTTNKNRRTRLEVGKNILEKFRTFGWSNGLHVPFASEANQQLEDILDTKQKKVLALQAELQDHAEHLQTLTSNFNRVSEDVNAHQILITYKKSDIKVTENLVNIAERVHSKVLQEKLHDIAETEKLEKRNYQRRKQLVSREEIIAELVEVVSYDKKLLNTYQKRTAKAEAEIDAVVDFKTQDERQLNEHEAKQVDLGAKRKHLRYRLDHQAMDTAKCQEQFNRASMEYRKVHDQRITMIEIWSKTLIQMRLKDKLMKDVADEFFALREHARELELLGVVKGRRLQEEHCAIKADELKLKVLDRRVCDARVKLSTERELLFNSVSGYTNMNGFLQNVSQLEQSAYRKARELKKNLQDIYKETTRMEDFVRALREKWKDIQGATKSTDDNVREAEDILQNEENSFDKMSNRLKWGQQFFWERSNEKVGIQADIMGVETRLHRIKNSTATLHSKISVNLEMLAKKSSKVYRLDLEASNLETRISRIEHDTIDPSYFALQDKIVSNRGMEQKLKDEQKFISKELEILKEHSFRTQREIQNYIDENKTLKNTLFEVDLVSRRNTKLLKKNIKEFHDTQVRHSLLQVYLKRLERARETTREQLGGLSEHRALVETVVKERTTEIDMHKVLFKSKLTSLRGAINKLNVQIGELRNFVTHLKGRFYLTSRMMMGPENSNPKEQTFAFQIRKAARERELLNKEVLKWQDCVDVAQKEMEGLQNVLTIMQASNTNLKKSISPAEEDSHEHIYTVRLEEIERQTLVNKNRAKKTKHALHNEINELQMQVTVVEQDLFASRAICDTKTHIASSSITELYRQHDKIARWNSLISRLTREIKSYINEEQAAKIQKELQLRFTTEKMECAINMVDRLLVSFPKILPKVLSHFQSNEETSDLVYRIAQHATQNKAKPADSSASRAKMIQRQVRDFKHKPVHRGVRFTKSTKSTKSARSKVDRKKQDNRSAPRGKISQKKLPAKKSIVELLALKRPKVLISTSKAAKN